MSKGTVEKYALLFVVCGIVFAANYAQYQVSGLAHLVVSDLHLTSAEFSAVLFAPFVPAVVFGMPVGVCADRYGVKALVFIASAISAIAAAARAECASFATLFTATMLLGAAPCVVNAIVLKVLGSAFGGETDRAMGWFYAAGSGGIACSLATSPLFATPGRAYALPRFCLPCLDCCGCWLRRRQMFCRLQMALAFRRGACCIVGKCVCGGNQDADSLARGDTAWSCPCIGYGVLGLSCFSA